MTSGQKKKTTMALVLLIIFSGVTFQAAYDRYSGTRKEAIRKNFEEIKEYKPTEGEVTALFFYTRKLKTLEQIRKFQVEKHQSQYKK